MDDEIKVSELPEAAQVNDADLVMIIQGGANKKITNQAFQSSNTTRLDTLETNVASNTARLDKKDARIVVNLTSNVTTSAEGTIPFSNVFFNNSDGLLTLNTTDNSIVIGEGISQIEVSAQAFFQRNNNDGDYQWTQIRQNGYAKSTSIGSLAGGFTTTVHAPIALTVAQGDKITLYRLTSSNTTIRANDNTYMQVKVIK